MCTENGTKKSLEYFQKFQCLCVLVLFLNWLSSDSCVSGIKKFLPMLKNITTSKNSKCFCYCGQEGITTGSLMKNFELLHFLF